MQPSGGWINLFSVSDSSHSLPSVPLWCLVWSHWSPVTKTADFMGTWNIKLTKRRTRFTEYTAQELHCMDLTCQTSCMYPLQGAKELEVGPVFPGTEQRVKSSNDHTSYP